MAKKQFLIAYPDGSCKHVSRVERDSLLLSREIKQIGEKRYVFTGQVRTFHTFQDLQQIRDRFEVKEFRHYLPGRFVVETPNKPESPMRRYSELLETPEAMAIRIGDDLQAA